MGGWLAQDRPSVCFAAAAQGGRERWDRKQLKGPNQTETYSVGVPAAKFGH